MGDQSLGRLIKKRRDALGFSQARLGELVGRSASTIRNWERGKSTPANPSDAVALAAVLGLEEGEVLERAGFEEAVPAEHRTVEQAYASLAPEVEIRDEAPADEPASEVEAPTIAAEPAAEKAAVGQPAVEEPAVEEPKRVEDLPVVEEAPVATPEPPPKMERPFAGLPTPAPQPAPEVEAPAASTVPEESRDQRPRRERRGERPWEPVDRPAREDRPRRLVAVPPVVADEPPAEDREIARAARPTVLEMAPPEEKSYIEDPEERQRYRARALGTAVLILILVIVLIWSFDRATDALGDMWGDFVDLLEI